jgi:Zn-dependent protease
VLGLFNLLPIPPLDGYNLVLPFLPPRTAFAVQRYATYGVLALLVLVVLSYGQGAGPLGWLFSGANWITGVLLGA